MFNKHFIFIQWEQKVDKGKDEFDRISKAIRKEVARFDKYRVEDFKDSVVLYLEQMMENQQRVSFATLPAESFMAPHRLWSAENSLFPFLFTRKF